MSLQLTAADLAVVLGAVTGLAGLWLRLQWRTRQEHARRKTLVDVSRSLRPGSELVERAADGTQLRITVGPASVLVTPAMNTAPAPWVDQAGAGDQTPVHGPVRWSPASSDPGTAGGTIIVDPDGRR